MKYQAYDKVEQEVDVCNVTTVYDLVHERHVYEKLKSVYDNNKEHSSEYVKEKI